MSWLDIWRNSWTKLHFQVPLGPGSISSKPSRVYLLIWKGERGGYHGFPIGRWTTEFSNIENSTPLSLKLLRTFYTEGLVDRQTFLVWFVNQMGTCNLAQAGFLSRLADEYLPPIMTSRALARPFVEACLNKMSEVRLNFSCLRNRTLINTHRFMTRHRAICLIQKNSYAWYSKSVEILSPVLFWADQV